MIKNDQKRIKNDQKLSKMIKNDQKLSNSSKYSLLTLYKKYLL